MPIPGTTTPTAGGSPGGPARQVRRRWRSRRLRWALCALALLVGVWWVLTASPLTKRLVLPRLAAASGLEVTASRVWLDLAGQLVLRDAEFRVPGVRGPAGRVVRVGRATADIDWRAAASGGQALRTLELIEPVVTISQSTVDGSLNITPLFTRVSPPPVPQPSQPAPSLPGSAQPVPALRLPTITLIDAAVELAEHTAESTTTLKRLPLNGRLAPDRAVTHPDRYTMALRETSRSGQGMRIDGSIEGGNAEITLNDLSLDEWPDSTLPSAIRGFAADLALRGTVPAARVTYSAAGGVRAELQLKGVALNLPVEPDSSFVPVGGPVMGPPTRLMRMRDVEGRIALTRDAPHRGPDASGVTAELAGTIEDLPYRVRLDYRGLSLGSPFTLEFSADKFQLERNPALLPYAPPKVREFLTMFSSPTALLTARGTITRAGSTNPDEPAPVAVEGVVDLEQGTAAYERFPYQFSAITGRFLFDSNSLRIEGMRGSTPDGATLAATAHVAPLDDSAEVRVSVLCENVPIDGTLQKAFGPARSGFIDALFSTRAYQDLLDRSLVRRSGTLDQPGGPPVFDLGGRARVAVNIYTPPGTDEPWTVKVDVDIPAAGLVIDTFPYPVRAENIRVEVLNEDGKLVAGRFRGIDGGDATVTAEFTVPKLSDADGRSNPRVGVKLEGLPVTPRSIHALPTGGTSPSRLKEILKHLAIDAALSGTVHITPKENAIGDDLALRADLAFSDATLSPQGFGVSPRVLATAAAGRLLATESTVELTFDALLRGPAAQTVEELAITTGPQRSPLRATVSYADGTGTLPPGLVVNATVPSLDLAIPVESMLWPFSTKAAEQVADLAKEHTPRGTLAIGLGVNQPPAADLAVRVDITPRGELALSARGEPMRLRFPEPCGQIVLDSSAATTLRFEDLTASIVDTRGTLRASGVYPIDAATSPSQLVVDLVDMPIESPLVAKALAAGLSPESLARVKSLEPRGIFDAQLRVAVDPARPEADRTQLTGTVRPRSLALTLPTSSGPQPLTFNDVTGSVEIEPGGGILRRLVAAAPAWSLSLDGAWTLPAAGQASPLVVKARASARADRLTPDLLAALPADVRSALAAISLTADGGVTLDDCTLELTQGPGPAEGSTSIDGTLTLRNAALDPGMPITNLDADATLSVRAPRLGTPVVMMPIRATALRAGGITITDAAANLRVDGSTITLEDLRGQTHGGRVAGHAIIEPDTSDPATPTARRFSADLRLAGVRFQPLLDELNPPKGQPILPPQRATLMPSQADLSRGIADAGLFVSGRMGDAASRRGRGEVTVARRGSRVLDLPLALRLIEVSNLQLPFGSSLDFARARFYVDGQTLAFEDLTATSSAITIAGYGTLDLNTKALDLRFNSTSARPIPVLSWLVEGVRDELVTAEVKGTVDNPTVGVVQLPATRRTIGRTVGINRGERSKLLDDIERRAAALRAAPPPATRQ